MFAAQKSWSPDGKPTNAQSTFDAVWRTVLALPASVRKAGLFGLLTPCGSWVPGYNSGDGIHPNDAGTSAAANLVLQSCYY